MEECMNVDIEVLRVKAKIYDISIRLTSIQREAKAYQDEITQLHQRLQTLENPINTVEKMCEKLC